jgi:hypothetical protein
VTFEKQIADPRTGNIMNLSSIKVRGYDPSQWTLRVYFRRSSSDGWEPSPDIQLDSTGFARLDIPVYEYYPEIEVMSGTPTATCEGVSVTLNDAKSKLEYISQPRSGIGAE